MGWFWKSSRGIAQTLQDSHNDQVARQARRDSIKLIGIIWGAIIMVCFVLFLINGYSLVDSLGNSILPSVCLMVFIAPIIGMISASKIRRGEGKNFTNKERW